MYRNCSREFFKVQRRLLPGVGVVDVARWSLQVKALSASRLVAKSISYPKCENCRRREQRVRLTRIHYTTIPGTDGYTRVQRLCQKCANIEITEESQFLDSQHGEPIYHQREECVAMNNDNITREDCGCWECLAELETYYS